MATNYRVGDKVEYNHSATYGAEEDSWLEGTITAVNKHSITVINEVYSDCAMIESPMIDTVVASVVRAQLVEFFECSKDFSNARRITRILYEYSKLEDFHCR